MTEEEQQAVDAKAAEEAKIAEEVKAQAEAVAAEKEADAAFNAGFEGKPIAEPTVAPATDGEPTPGENAEPVQEPVPPIEVKYAQITEQQFADILAKANSVDELKTAIDKRFNDTFGRVGGLEQSIQRIQASTPAGQPVVVSEEDMKELREEFPDLTSKLVTGLTRSLAKLKGTGSAPGLTPEQVQQHVNPMITQAVAKAQDATRKEQAVERLRDRYENWEEIVGPEGSQTAYRAWLKSQGTEYEARVLSSWDSREIGKSIAKFTEAQKTTVKPQGNPAGDARSKRLEQAVPPKGGTSIAPRQRTLTDDEQFEAGFKSGRG